MDGLHHTLGVYDWHVKPIGADEQLFTRTLDDLIDKQLNDPDQIAEFVARAKANPNRLVRGKQQNKGEEQLNTWSGTQHDDMVKHLVADELATGRLKSLKGGFRPNWGKGPDFIGPDSVAWDLTTMGSVDFHLRRDPEGRGWQRYYVLVWDDIQISSREARLRQRSATTSNG
jgi:hypothetical protein